jgi:hypothetical protein
MDREKFERLFNYFQNRLENSEKFDEVSGFLLAICHVKLGDYIIAQQLFEKSCLAMFRPPRIWKVSSQVGWFVDVWILSTKNNLYPKVIEELENFKKDMPKSNVNSLVAQYSYALVELLYPTGIDISVYIKNLMAYPKIRDLYAIGEIFRAIIARDMTSVNAGMEKLLNVHQGKAKHGVLRETPEGFLCMSAMSLAYAAHQYGLKVNINNEYFSAGYLEFLIEHTN